MRFVDAGEVRRMLDVAGRVLRAIIGAPDYERYLAHLESRHPGTLPLSREEFGRQRLESRYSRPGSRCC
jgi:uncharacterized short protein YbdD (DUF466 family)